MLIIYIFVLKKIQLTQKEWIMTLYVQLLALSVRRWSPMNIQLTVKQILQMTQNIIPMIQRQPVWMREKTKLRLLLHFQKPLMPGTHILIVRMGP